MKERHGWWMSGIVAAVLVCGSPAWSAIITTDDPGGADAYVDGGQPDLNYGNATNVKINLGFTMNSYCNKTYIRFGLGSGPHTFTDGALKLTLTDAYNYGDSPFYYQSVYLLNDGDPGENWNEGTITWNNAPANDVASTSGLLSNATLIGTLSNADYDKGISLGSIATFVVPSAALNADTNGVVTFILVEQVWGMLDREYASKENTIYAGPILEVVPEPVTMILLGFGGLLLRRRK